MSLFMALLIGVSGVVVAFIAYVWVRVGARKPTPPYVRSREPWPPPPTWREQEPWDE